MFDFCVLCVISDEVFFTPSAVITQFLVLRTKNVNLSHYNMNIKNTKPEVCTLIIQWLQLASTKIGTDTSVFLLVFGFVPATVKTR